MNLSVTPDLWVQNEAEYLEWLNNDLQWKSIPLLNANDLQDLHDKKLVRFRGMVQDMFNPEYYHEKYEVMDINTKEKSIRNGKFTFTWCKNSEILNHSAPSNVNGERQTLVLITMPGLNKWVNKLEKEHYKIEPKLASEYSESPSKLQKRTLDLEEQMDTQSADVPQSSVNENKKQCTTQNSESSAKPVVSQEHLLNFPIAERTGKACHAIVYNGVDQIKLNDMLEVVGFLSVDPILTDVDCDDECDSEMEVQTHNPPPSLVPRIHCVTWKKIEHNNPLVDGTDVGMDKFQTWKKELLIVLTQLFMGDSVAAEYFILHLISRVYLRSQLLPLGKFTLNISHIPVFDLPDYGTQLYEFIELLLPKSHYMPMTLDNMNEIAFTPKKDYQCNRITSGLLQLSNNTHLVLDETKLSPGRLNESGVRAVTAISNSIKTQKTMYDFNFYPMEFDCDIPFLILSEAKSLLPSDFHVVLQADRVCINTFNEILEAAKHFLKPELLNDLRVYLTVARHGKYELDDNVQELIQTEFVRMRQAEKKVTSDDLHQLLVVARLVCLSEGKTTLDADCWKKTCDLEVERKTRIANL